MGPGSWEVKREKIMDHPQVSASRTRWLFTHVKGTKEKQVCVRRPEIYRGDFRSLESRL